MRKAGRQGFKAQIHKMHRRLERERERREVGEKVVKKTGKKRKG